MIDMKAKKRLRRSMLFLNCQKPALIRDPYVYRPDSIMLDLEDAVAENQKDAARFSLYHALRTVDYRGVERVVRINGLDTPHWQEDVRVCVAGGADVIRIPKCTCAADVQTVEEAVYRAERLQILRVVAAGQGNADEPLTGAAYLQRVDDAHAGLQRRHQQRSALFLTEFLLRRLNGLFNGNNVPCAFAFGYAHAVRPRRHAYAHVLAPMRRIQPVYAHYHFRIAVINGFQRMIKRKPRRVLLVFRNRVLKVQHQTVCPVNERILYKPGLLRAEEYHGAP
mgnify:CR=1 FL=1